jgi:hypothetical protein
MSRTKFSLAGIIKLFPAWERLVSDIPAGEGKTITFFWITIQEVMATNRILVVCLDSPILRLFLVLLVLLHLLLVLLLVLLHLTEVRVLVEDSWMPQL